jgi:DNA-binding transcriptional LysR family regulator
MELPVIAVCDNVRCVELRQLATFIAVADERSFTRASDRLHVVQSAVSAGVRKLERELGATLFDRSTRKVELTDAGRALLPGARATIAAATAARDAVDDVSGGVRGTVLLGTMQAQGMRAIDVPGLIAQFREAHPGVEVHVRHAAGGSSEMAEQVRDGRLDLAFISLLTRELAGVELTQLAREPIMLLAPSSHPLASRKSVPLAALSGEPLVEFPIGWGIRVANDRAFAAAGVTRTITYEVNDTAIVTDFVRLGLAVSLLPASLVDDRTELRLIPIRGHAPEFVTAIATPSNRTLSAAARALLQTVEARGRRPMTKRSHGGGGLDELAKTPAPAARHRPS